MNLNYRIRELLKRAAWHLWYSPISTDEDRSNAAENILAAHYARSKEFYRCNAVQHPQFPQYVAMLLASKKFWEKQFNSQVYDELVEKYGIISGEIPAGKTFYYPPNSKERQWQFKHTLTP